MKALIKKKHKKQPVGKKKGQISFSFRPRSIKSNKPFRRFINKKNNALPRSSTRGFLHYGALGIKSTNSFRLRVHQIEAIRKYLLKHFRKKIKFVFRNIVFDSPRTLKGAGTRQGGGKGKIDHFVCNVPSGSLLVEAFVTGAATIGTRVPVSKKLVYAYKKLSIRSFPIETKFFSIFMR